MREAETVDKAILNALQKAAEEGLSVGEILSAVARVEELDVWFEPASIWRYSLIIAIKDGQA